MCSQDLDFLILILPFILLKEQIVHMASLEISVSTIVTVSTQRPVTELVDTVIQDVRLDGKETAVNKVRQYIYIYGIHVVSYLSNK